MIISLILSPPTSDLGPTVPVTRLVPEVEFCSGKRNGYREYRGLDYSTFPSTWEQCDLGTLLTLSERLFLQLQNEELVQLFKPGTLALQDLPNQGSILVFQN